LFPQHKTITCASSHSSVGCDISKHTSADARHGLSILVKRRRRIERIPVGSIGDVKQFVYGCACPIVRYPKYKQSLMLLESLILTLTIIPVGFNSFSFLFLSPPAIYHWTCTCIRVSYNFLCDFDCDEFEFQFIISNSIVCRT
jgi:hypothetical protein